MRIAQVAPLAESAPPRLYGGTERVVAWLIDELVELGHEVTLFASGDSRTRARLVPACPRALRLGRPRRDPMAAGASLLSDLAEHAAEFDVIRSVRPAFSHGTYLAFLGRLTTDKGPELRSALRVKPACRFGSRQKCRVATMGTSRNVWSR